MAASLRRILLLQGHPDPLGGHFCHAIAERYLTGAHSAGHVVEEVVLARLDLPFVRSRDDFRRGAPPAGVAQVQLALRECDHVVLIYPIWNGGAPALVRAFMEQAFRPSFTFPQSDSDAPSTFMSAMRARKVLGGKSAHVITTMQMPAWTYRLLFRPHQEASALWLAGARPVRQTPLGGVERPDDSGRQLWLDRIKTLGARAG